MRLIRVGGLGALALGAGYLTVFAPVRATSQLMGAFPRQGKTTAKVVALTFDDGPNEPFTSDLLRVLDEARVRATFFQVGACVERHPALPRTMADAGHVIGNHSYSHRFTRYAYEPSLRRDIARAQHTLTEAIGRAPALFRPPWLCHQPPLLRAVRDGGLQVVGGVFAHPLEPAQIAPERIARHAARLVRPGSIVIMHDGFDARGGYRGSTVTAAAMLIDELTQRGFGFATVDDLLGVSAYQPR